MKPAIKTFIICFCLLLLLSCNSIPKRNLYAGKVTRVLSGHTVEARLTGSSEVVKLRVKGIDAPDWRQNPWGTAARKKLEDLVKNKSIAIETDNLQRDRYNRIHGHLWQGQILVSQELVETGCVLANDRYSDRYSNLLRSSQEYARLMGYGIWNPQQPMRYTPSQFRSQNTP